MSSTRIKVGDLLLHIGQTDMVPFSGINLPSINGLTKSGISGVLHLQSIDNSTIIATLENVRCSIDDISDVSGVEYIRDVLCVDFFSYFVLADIVGTFNQEDDASVFLIDEKNMIIDIADMLYEAIVLQTPFVKRTPEEERLYIDAGIDDFDDLGDAPIGGQIIFRTGKNPNL